MMMMMMMMIQSLLKRLFGLGYSTHPVLFHDLSKSCTDHSTSPWFLPRDGTQSAVMPQYFCCK